MRRAALSLGIALVVASCGSDTPAGEPASSAPVSGPAVTEPPAGPTSAPAVDQTTVAPAVDQTTVAPPAATTVAPPVAATSTSVPEPSVPGPLIGELPDGTCTFDPAEPAGSVTFVVGMRLYASAVDGSSVRCLAELAAPVGGSLVWSPSGDRLLISGSLVLGPNGVGETGFLAENTGVRWSRPTGSAFIAPAVADGALLWRDSSDPSDRIDISFLTRTDVATYHPAGRDIVAAGVGTDGAAGLYVAGNRGQNPRLVISLEDPETRFTEIEAGASGDVVFFVHDHGSVWELHGLTFPNLQITTITDGQEPIGALTISNDFDASVAVRVGSCDGRTTAVAVIGAAAPDASAVDVTAGSPIAEVSTSPVGWVDGSHLLLLARPTGCEGPADLWMWNADGGTLLRLLADVDGAATRTVLSEFGELPGDINPDAPG